MGFEKVLYFSKKMLDRWCATVLSHVWQIRQRGKVCAARGNTNPISPIKKVPIGAFKIDKPNAYLGKGVNLLQTQATHFQTVTTHDRIMKMYFLGCLNLYIVVQWLGPRPIFFQISVHFFHAKRRRNMQCKPHHGA
jgi:hypothetical protein